MTALGYRISQFLRALVTRPAPGDDDLVRAYLSPPLASLFQRMSPDEQSHSLAVLRSLRRRGHEESDLMAAALLHDVGKTLSPLRLTDRVLVVLGQRWLPVQARRWGQEPPRGWRRPFVVAACHAAWGEELVRQAGGSPALQELVRRHHDSATASPADSTDCLLATLQAADGRH